MSITKIRELIKGELEECEKEIARQLSSSIGLISEVGSYIARAGGKRFRPTLLLLCSRLCDYNGYRSIYLASVVEILHTATLIHDDVVDNATLRRGKPSANTKWGGDVSILVGDFLYSKSFALLVRDNDKEVMESLARATLSMTEAEVFQLIKKLEGRMTEEDYISIISKKTASFISACCKIGAVLGGVSQEKIDAVSKYGMNVGIAFQIIDDSLDFVADEKKFGKAIGTDIRNGKRTLPLIYAYLNSSAMDKKRIESIFRGSMPGDEGLSYIYQLVRSYDGVEYARSRAKEFIEEAKEALSIFDDSVYRKALFAIGDFVIERDR